MRGLAVQFYQSCLHTTGGRVNYEETKQLFINNVLTEIDDGTQVLQYQHIDRYYRRIILINKFTQKPMEPPKDDKSRRGKRISLNGLMKEWQHS